MKRVLVYTAVLATLVGCANVEDKQNRREAEIRMVDQQMQARAQMEVDKARAQAALYNAMATIAQNNPESADAIAVGMALAVSKQGDGSQSWGSVVTLSQEKDPALEWAKVLAAPVLNTATALGSAAIAANVSKNASDNMARVSINEAEQQSRQFEALAGLGSAAADLGSTAIQNAGGNTTYNMDGDNAFVNNGENAVDSYNTTETNSTTETTTTTTSGDTIDDNSSNTNSTYLTNIGTASGQDIVDIVLSGGTVDIYTAAGPVTVDDDNLCTIFPDLSVCAP